MKIELDNLKEFKKTLEDAKVGSVINDQRAITVERVVVYEDGGMYLLICQEADFFIKLDKKTFDAKFASREILGDGIKKKVKSKV